MSQNGVMCNTGDETWEAAGFTLVEVIVSMLLVLLLSQMALNIILLGYRQIECSARQTLAGAYAVSLLEEMKAHPQDFIENGETAIVDGTYYAFATPVPDGMSAAVTIRPFSSHVYQVEILVTGEGGERAWEESVRGFVRGNI